MEDIPNFKGKIDVMVLCGGSATDLIEQTPMVTKYFNCIDSFDTHARIPEHFANVDKVAKAVSYTHLDVYKRQMIPKTKIGLCEKMDSTEDKIESIATPIHHLLSFHAF